MHMNTLKTSRHCGHVKGAMETSADQHFRISFCYPNNLSLSIPGYLTTYLYRRGPQRITINFFQKSQLQLRKIGKTKLCSQHLKQRKNKQVLLLANLALRTGRFVSGFLQTFIRPTPCYLNPLPLWQKSCYPTPSGTEKNTKMSSA